MSFKIGNSSPFRFASLSAKTDETYRFKNAAPATANGTSLAASAKFVAFGLGSGGNLGILPVDYKAYERKDTPFSVQAHGSDLCDWAFSPHNDLLLATGSSGDNTVKIFDLPAEGLTANYSTAKQTLTGLESVLALKWHPTASDVLGVVGKNVVNVVNVATGSKIKTFSMDGHGKDVVSLDWSYDGALLGTALRTGSIAIADPRTSNEEFLSGATDVSSVYRQIQHIKYVGKNTTAGHWMVFGLDKFRKPTVSFWDPRNMSAPALKQSLDFSSGQLIPLYDVDTNLVMLTMRGSASMEIFDIGDGKSGAPTWSKTQSASLAGGLKGGCLLPKRALDTHVSEIARVMVLTGDNSIVGHTCKVPRKVKGYDPVLYPATADTKAAQTVDQYIAGGNATPNTVTMDFPLRNAAWAQAVVGKKLAQSKKQEELAASKEAQAAADLEAKTTYVSSSVRLGLNTKFKQSIYRHLQAQEPDTLDKKNYYFDLKPSRNLMLNQNIKVNDTFWAMPWASVGGSALAVHPLVGKGRMKIKFGKIRGHQEQVSTFDLSPHDQFLAATATTAGVAKTWRIPSKDGLTTDLNECEQTLECEGKVSRVMFHPYVPECLVTCATDFDGQGSITFWNTKNGQKEIELESTHDGIITDVSFSPYCSLIATSCKDGFIRIINVKTKEIVKKFAPLETKRDTQVILMSRDRVLTSGFQRGSRRTMSLWDLSGDLTKPLSTHDFFAGTGSILIHYDRDSQIIFASHHAAFATDTFRVLNDKLDKLNTSTAFSDLRGIAFFNKHACDVKGVEVLKSVRLSKNEVIPMSWTVPRKRKEFFQDDLYPDTMAPGPVQSADAFFNGTPVTELNMVSLQPQGMTPLSQAPAEGLTERQLRYKANLAAKEEVKPQSHLGHTDNAAAMDHFRNMANSFKPSANRWDAKPESCSDDEWSDSD